MNEFVRWTSARPIVRDRMLDTVLGCSIGLVAAVVVTNRRAGSGVTAALGRTRLAYDALGRAHHDEPARLHAARTALTAELARLRTAYDTALGEWWQAPLPHDEVITLERAGHELLRTTRPAAPAHAAA
jgi:hypothetical protein